MCRFTGLLLATKLLPAGDAAAVQAVHDAVGMAFINRLLVVLQSSKEQVSGFVDVLPHVESAPCLQVHRMRQIQRLQQHCEALP